MNESESEDFRPKTDLDVVIISEEESALAEMLGGFQPGYWAHVLFRLSPAAKNELRSVIGTLHAEASYPQEEWIEPAGEGDSTT